MSTQRPLQFVSEGRQQRPSLPVFPPVQTFPQAPQLLLDDRLVQTPPQFPSENPRQGDYEAAHALYEESLSIARELGTKGVIEETLRAIGSVALARGDYDAALAYHEARLAIAREVGSAWGIVGSLYFLGLLARDRGEGSRAGTLWSEGLAISQRLGDKQGIADYLEGFASLAGRPGLREAGSRDRGSSGSRETGVGPDRAQRAARLLGAAEAARELVGALADPQRRAEHERQVAAVRATLDAAAFAATWAEGRAMTMDQAIAAALRAAGDSL